MIMKHRPMQRFTFVYSMGLALLTALWLGGPSVMAQTPPAWENLTEQLVAVELSPGVRQEGVLSLRTGTQSPDVLAVLLPGYTSALLAWPVFKIWPMCCITSRSLPVKPCSVKARQGWP